MLTEPIANDVTDDQLDLIFKALSDRTRREQLKMLYKGPISVSRLAAKFDMTLPAVSKHLKVLEKAGLIDRQKKGRVSMCSFNPEKMQEVNHWLTTNQDVWQQSLDNLANYFIQNKDQ
ncbi:MAG: DNA-binding transcriptional ArsR family regulator [Oceanospirillaceae bacterium]|jgi:DNA-binding transcriptional ArsR family regulator